MHIYIYIYVCMYVCIESDERIKSILKYYKIKVINVFLAYKIKRQTLCPPSYYQSTNGPMVTHVLGHMMYGS